MKKSQLKSVVKPLVKECIYEILLEEGLLSNVVAEVAKGMQSTVIVEEREPVRQEAPRQRQRTTDDTRAKLQEHRRKLADAIGKEAYNGVNVFEDVQPMQQTEPAKGQADLGNPNDSGVDISSLIGNASQIWKAIK